uniref:Uncharacterized protein n=1 Tax=Candidatus Kentrum sp. DK TaxID=2126562 RepID=A0A450T469_9GAMM|nr:MAG: hypothetical protein BECKDK2373C_GA0170839_10877 [Candidatus Kentron sp. DK]
MWKRCQERRSESRHMKIPPLTRAAPVEKTRHIPPPTRKCAPLIALAICGGLELLEPLYGEVLARERP